ncbi:MAG TPA: hypothetical protein VGF55_29130 [Gemmataceae bacterium]|jgi:hypothetical protein
MAIAFKCPSCQQPYKVKDDMAGKRVVCTSCKKPMRVPAPVAAPAVPDHAAEDLAHAALADAPATPAEEAAASITVECPNCIEQVTFPADLAGKQAPCPNCKRIIRVPVPATGKKDWRTADARPTFAKVTPEADLKDVVSTANMTVVDRESLAEAGALRKRERPRLTTQQKVTRIVIGALVLALIVVGALLFRTKKTIQRRDDFVQRAVGVVRDNTSLPAGVRAETYRAAGEYVLAQPDGPADAARQHLANARDSLTGTDHPFERVALLGRIAVTQADLVGPDDRIRAGNRLDWKKVLTELRYTLDAIDKSPDQRDGVILVVRGLTRKLGLSGPTDQPAVNTIALKLYDAPGDKADAVAAVGLELLAAGEPGQKKAAELAEQARTMGPEAASMPRVIALHLALKQPLPGLREPAGNEPVPPGVRVGCAEGYARRGDVDAARKVAALPGSAEDRFQAHVALAAAQPGDDADLTAAVKLFADEFKNRDLPGWPLIHLARLCAEAKSPEPAKDLNTALAELANLSPRSQAVRAWAQMELLRSPHLPASDIAVKAITPETALGSLLAWEVLARRTAPDSVDGWPEAARPLGLVGSALGRVR